MSSLVGRIKDKIRHASDSNSSDRPTTADSYSEAQPEATNEHYPTGTTPSHYYSNPPRASLENSAFHIHRGRKSLDHDFQRPNPPPKDDIPAVPIVPAHIGAAGAAGAVGAQGTQVPYSSTRTRTEQNDMQASDFSNTPTDRYLDREAVESSNGRRLKTGNNAEAPEDIVEEMIPTRHSSRHAVPASPEMTSPKRKAVPSPQQTSGSPGHETSLPYRTTSRRDLNGTGSSAGVVNSSGVDEYGRPDGHSVRIARPNGVSSRSRDVAGDSSAPSRDAGLQDSARLASMYLQESTKTADKENMLQSGHLRLPEGFNMQNTEETHVHEEVRPAVIRETIIKERTEIVQEAITRDIHVHHYYTYAQPVKVVEVLPAKHYHLDLVTGVKTQIPAPQGWQLPPNMQPVLPDTNAIKSWTRHYLVDEANPTGIPEPPPLSHASGHDDLRHEAARERRV